MMESQQSKKRIVLIGPAYPYRGGQALTEAHLYNLLKQHGYDCHTITYTLLYPKIFFPGKTQFDASSTIYYEHNDRIYRLISSMNPFSWIRAYQRIRQINPAIVIIVWWMPFLGPCLGTISWLSKFFLKTQIVFLIENYLSHENRWFDRMVTRLTLKLADHIIVQSQYIQERHIQPDFPGTPVHLARIPVFDCFDQMKYTSESARDILQISQNNIVLFFGYVRPYKGLKNLIRCFNGVLHEHPDAILLVVGEFYEDISLYQELIKQENLEKSIRIIPQYVSNEDVEIYFKAADLTCLPYDSATQSGVLMLSYGFRKPAVVTDVAGLPEFVENGKTGVVVEKKNPRQLAEGINQILSRKETFDYGSAISQYIEKHGSDAIRDILQDIMARPE